MKNIHKKILNEYSILRRSADSNRKQALVTLDNRKGFYRIVEPFGELVPKPQSLIQSFIHLKSITLKRTLIKEGYGHIELAQHRIS